MVIEDHVTILRRVFRMVEACHIHQPYNNQIENKIHI